LDRKTLIKNPTIHLMRLGHSLDGEMVEVSYEELVEVLAEVDVEMRVEIAGVVAGFSFTPVGILLKYLGRVLPE